MFMRKPVFKGFKRTIRNSYYYKFQHHFFLQGEKQRI